MLPTIASGDVLVGARIGLQQLQLRDIVIYRAVFADGQRQTYVKRIAALPGTMMSNRCLANDEYWVLGDNSARSGDSRQNGPVNRRDIIGVALGIVRGTKLFDLHRSNRGWPKTIIESLIDLVRHVDTTGREADDDDYALVEGRMYAPSPWRPFAEVLSLGDVRDFDVLLDVGSGKGRVLMAALNYPFRRIIGVEISAALADVARANVRRCRQSPRVVITVGDARSCAIPDDVTCVYLYNPLTPTGMSAFMDRLDESNTRSPRRIRVICRGIRDSEASFMARGFGCVARTADLELYERGAEQEPARD